MSILRPARRRRRLPWAVLATLVVLAVLAVVVVAILDEPARPQHLCCRQPPDTSGNTGMARDWQAAVTRRDVQAAWRLLTPHAQRRYGSANGLRAALSRLTPDPHRPAAWLLIHQVSQGRGTPSQFLYMLIEKRTLRPAGAIVIESMADGTADGRVDPAPIATLHILEPAPHATLDDRPHVRVTANPPPAYVAVQASGQTHGTMGSIRGPDGRDAPFYEPLKPGPALIIATEIDDQGHFAYGSVRITIR